MELGLARAGADGRRTLAFARWQGQARAIMITLAVGEGAGCIRPPCVVEATWRGGAEEEEDKLAFERQEGTPASSTAGPITTGYTLPHPTTLQPPFYIHSTPQRDLGNMLCGEPSGGSGGAEHGGGGVRERSGSICTLSKGGWGRGRGEAGVSSGGQGRQGLWLPRLAAPPHSAWNPSSPHAGPGWFGGTGSTLEARRGACCAAQSRTSVP